MNQFKSRMREHAAELEANAATYSGLILELFRREARLEFVEILARKIKAVVKDDNVYHLISRKFSEPLIEEIDQGAAQEQMEHLRLDPKASEAKVKEELDTRLQEYAKELQLDFQELLEYERQLEKTLEEQRQFQKQIEEQRQILKQRDKEAEKLLEQVEEIHDRYLGTESNPVAETVVRGGNPSRLIDAVLPTTNPQASSSISSCM